MTLTLTLEVFCRSNYLHLNDIVMVLTKTKHNDNMTTNYGTINLNMRKMTHFKQFFCFCDLDLGLK